MKLIIVNGLPATGKSTIAKSISSELDIPMIGKDDIKEFLFDTLGVKDRKWSTTLGKASSNALYNIADILLADGHSIIIESAFFVDYTKPKIDSLVEKYHPIVIEVYCSASQEIRRQRFINRAESGQRHVGHVDHTNFLKDIDPEPLDTYAPIGVGRLLTVDTSSSIAVNINTLCETIRSIK